jgi:nucleoside-diphosphate-sugar epimerase
MMLLAEKETVSGSFYYVDDGVPARSWFDIQNELAKALDVWTVPLKLPLALAFVSIAAMHIIQKITGKRSFLNLNKYSEMAQRAWICDGRKICDEFGYSPKVTVEDGFVETTEWYREAGWL